MYLSSPSAYYSKEDTPFTKAQNLPEVQRMSGVNKGSEF